jgi:hypothetical protein
MKLFPLFFALVFAFVFVMPQAHAVNTPKDPDKKAKQAEVRHPIDELSLIAYLSAVAGIGALFVVPVATLFLLPAALVMGIVALTGGRKRYERKRGRTLALIAVILGGAFTALFAVAIVATMLMY